MKIFTEQTGKIIIKNLWKLLICQVVCEIIAAYIIIPAISHGFSLVLKIMKYSNVTKENYMNIVFSVPFFVYLFIILLIIMLLFLLNMTAFVTVLNGILQEEKYGIIGYLFYISRNYIKFLLSKKIRYIGYIIPFGIAVYMPAVIMALYGNSMSGYLISKISRNHELAWWCGIFVIFVVSIVIFTFKFPFMSCLILDDGSIRKAKRRTEEYFPDKLKRALKQLVWSFAIFLLCTALYLAAVFIMYMILKIFFPDEKTMMLFYDNFEIMNMIVFIVVVTVCGICNITALTGVSKSFQVGRYVNRRKKQDRAQIITTAVFLAVSMVGLYLSTDMYMNGDSLRMTGMGEVSVTAHRGYSSKAPENTLDAISAAIDEGVDYVEIDVRLTADGYVVLMHDSNTRRTADRAMTVEDETYDTLKQLDVGSWFSDEYAGTVIPTLNEAIELCKGKVYMNIELKPANGSGELERAVAEIITEYNMEDQCIVTSFNQSSLVRIKNENPDIRTGCIYTVGYSNKTDYKAMDVLSIDSRYVSRSLVVGAHEKGIMVFVWTVNTRSEMLRMTACGVDGIITDKPELLKQVLYKNSSGGLPDAYKYAIGIYKN